MASKCFMCGRDISKGILCDKCDKPRRPKQEGGLSGDIQQAAAESQPEPQAAPAPPKAAPTITASAPRPSTAKTVTTGAQAAVAYDAFPEASIVPFPVESASPAITSVMNVLIAAGTASVLIGPDRTVKFVSDEASKLFDVPHSDLANLKFIESKSGVRIGDLTTPASAGIRIRDHNILYSLVPISGGASGAVLVFRPADSMRESHASFATYVRETILGPLRSLRESFLAAAAARPDPLLQDSAATVDQILSSLEMAPEVEEQTTGPRELPTVSDVVQQMAKRFASFADLKGIQLQVDAPDLDERFRNHEQLSESLAILMDNSLHYVPPGGQVVIGVRWMEHKGRPLLLFFVMDNGPLVPEELRQTIFDSSFVWNPSAPERTGRSLSKTREFAIAHGGQVWVQSETGKACTFFLRVRPDGAR